jgi:hypothetical protein
MRALRDFVSAGSHTLVAHFVLFRIMLGIDRGRRFRFPISIGELVFHEGEMHWCREL